MPRALVLLAFVPLLLGACGDDAVELVVPVVTITAPIDGSSVSGTVTLTAEVSGPVGIARVSFAVDGEEIGSVDGAPFSLQWDSSAHADGETHSLLAEAEDFDGNLGFSDYVVVTIRP